MLVEPSHPEISMRRQCELLGVNRSGLYYEPLGESDENLALMRLLDEQYTRTPFYGSRKMVEWLDTQGFEVNRKRVSRLMALMGIEAVYPKPRLSQPGDSLPIHPEALRVEPLHHFSAPVERRPHILFVQQPHQHQVLFAFANRLVVETGPAHAQQLALPPHADLLMIPDNQPPQSLSRAIRLFF